MTTGCMRSALEPEHQVTTRDSNHYQGAIASTAGMDSEIKDEEKALGNEHQEKDQLTKPRRKDTPVLNLPPHIPGVRLMKAEKHMVHREDNESDNSD
ncbi:protein phosphatase 1 regulatory subunit 17 isoform X2 [Thalassophryne amazonica]|nr:protein phosphatase 1 regulatory subunit 17 isoform X2 [Thalassophryne amazonica]